MLSPPVPHYILPHRPKFLDTMIYYIILYCIVLYYIILYYIILYYIILYYIILYYIILIVSYCIILYYIILYYIILYYIVSYHIISCHILYYIILYYIILYYIILYYILYLTLIRFTPGGSSTVHIYTQTIHRTTQSTQTLHRTTQFTNLEECGPCPVFARYTLEFALQLGKKHGKPSVRVAGECQLAKSIQIRAYLSIRIHKEEYLT